MKAHPDEVKAAVMAALLAGQSVGQAAKEFDLPEATIKTWKRQGMNHTPPKKEIGELLMEYLQANLETLKVQAEIFRNQDWLEKQGASETAVLHGVMTDKAIRLIEAMSKANNVSGDHTPEG